MPPLSGSCAPIRIGWVAPVRGESSMDLNDLTFVWINALFAGRTFAYFAYFVRERFSFLPAQVTFQSEQAHVLLWRHLHPGFRYGHGFYPALRVHEVQAEPKRKR